MSLIYVTGPSGAGKTTVCKLLKHRGYRAYDVDGGGVSSWFNKSTNKSVTFKPSPSKEWLDNHHFLLSTDKVNGLLELSKDEDVYLCGTATNDIDFFNVFDRIYCLLIDKETMQERLSSRSNNSFGKSDEENELIRKWFDATIQRYKDAGAEMIDATMPVDKVVDAILDSS